MQGSGWLWRLASLLGFRGRTTPSVEFDHMLHLQMGCGQGLTRSTAEGLAFGNLGCFCHQDVMSDSPTRLGRPSG